MNRKNLLGHSSSKPENIQLHFEKISKLGQIIADELNGQDHPDIATTWMANYLGDLIEKTRNAPVDKTENLSKEICDLILKIWEHRAFFPSGVRPFEELEPVIATLRKLDPDANHSPYYNAYERETFSREKDNIELNKWLKFAEGIDKSAKILINYIISKARKTVSDKTIEFLHAGQQADPGLHLDIQLASLFVSNEETEKRILEDEVKKIEKRIECLQLLNDLAAGIRLELEIEKSEIIKNISA